MRDANQLDIYFLKEMLSKELTANEYDREYFDILKDINPDYYTLGFNVITKDDVLKHPMFIDGHLTVTSNKHNARVEVKKLEADIQKDIRIQLHNTVKENFFNLM